MRKFKVGALFLSSFFAITCSNDQMLRTRANELAQKFIITDGHIDTPWKLSKNYEDISLRTKTGDFDYVRAKNRDGGNLPRIPPFRIGGSLSYEFNLLSTSFDVMHVFNQSDIESNELKTDGYTDLSFNMSYKLPIESKVSLYLKGTNLLDEEQRDHTSFLKDKTLMGERALTFGLSGTF